MKLYTSKLRDNRKELRKESTPYEQLVWDAIRSQKLGVKFRRQVSIGEFIVDFCSLKLKLIIEIDGAEHFTPIGALNDGNRDDLLSKAGYTIIRFENEEVYKNLDRVIESIRLKIEELG